MRDYLKELDLNPPLGLGGPVNNPTDPRAMHYFGFLSEGQELVLVPGVGGTSRVFASWHYVNQPLLTLPVPPPLVDVVLDFASGPPVVRYEGFHERAHAIVWLDPAAPIVTGPLIVRLRAWATGRLSAAA